MNASWRARRSPLATVQATGVAAVDVDDHEQLVVDAALGPGQLRDVPAPHLVGAPGDQLGSLCRMGALPAPFPVLPGDPQVESAHRGDRAQIHAVIDQLLGHLRRGEDRELLERAPR